jgi:hypothetical protein
MVRCVDWHTHSKLAGNDVCTVFDHKSAAHFGATAHFRATRNESLMLP